MKKLFLLTVSLLCSLLTVNAYTITFNTQSVDDLAAITAKCNGMEIQSGDQVNLGSWVYFSVAESYGKCVDWYVNGVRDTKAVGNTFKVFVIDSYYIEARYREPFKMIYEGTPFVRYANEKGVVSYGHNYFHHNNKVEKGGYAYSVDYWTGSNGKQYKTANGGKAVLDTLTADVVLTPHYVLNSSDIGDGTATAVWTFGYPDSVALFRDFKDKCPFVTPVLFKSTYADVAMSIDATAGGINNYQSGVNVAQIESAQVQAGTRFTVPVIFGASVSVVSRQPLSASTIGGATDYVPTVSGNYFVSSKPIYQSNADSIDIVINEPIDLVSLSVSYPGGLNTLTWMPNVMTAESAIGTQAKTGQAGAMLNNLSDITNVGALTVYPSATDQLSSMIQVVPSRNPDQYMAVSFDVAEGFSFRPDFAVVPIRLTVGNNVCTELVMEDEYGTRMERIFEKQNGNVLLNDSLLPPTVTDQSTLPCFRGHVTLKIYVYGMNSTYRLGSPISIQGIICKTIAFPEGQWWMPCYMDSGVDFDGFERYKLTAYEVVAVEEEEQRVVSFPIEEIPMGQVVLLRSDVAGATYNVPITRCDDAYDTRNNLLHVSDGTITGNNQRYVYRPEVNNKAFVLTTDGEVLPEGTVYLERKTFTQPPVLYFADADDAPSEVVEPPVPPVPTGINRTDAGTSQHMVRRVVRNGAIVIVMPDGTCYNLSGVRIKTNK